jgi:hypothetical protein
VSEPDENKKLSKIIERSKENKFDESVAAIGIIKSSVLVQWYHFCSNLHRRIDIRGLKIVSMRFYFRLRNANTYGRGRSIRGIG